MESLLSHLFCTLPQYKMSLEEHGLLITAGTSTASFATLHPRQSFLPALPRAMRGEPKSQGQALSPRAGS